MKTTTKKLAALLLAAALLITAAAPAFASVDDVKPTNWAYKAIRYSVENKLIAVDYSAYDMEASAPRQDVAYALYKLTNGKDNEPDRLPCTQYIPQDMQNSPDKYKYSVQWAVENEIIAGIKNEGDHDSTAYKTWFAPGDIVTREQMAGLLHRLAGHDGLDTLNYNTILLNSYADGNKTAGWAKDSMAWCVMNGLMKGIGGNRLDPKGTLTYAQLAQLVMMYGELKAEAGVTPGPSPSPSPSPSPDPNAKSGNYYAQTAHPEDADKTDWLDDVSKYTITSLSGPWDSVKPVTDIPNGGYVKDGHRYNKYDVCIDTVDGIPNDEEKKAIILINQHRLNNGLKPLIWNQAVQVMAETRAIEGYGCHYTKPNTEAHVRPDGNSQIDFILNEWNKIGILSTNAYNSWLNENAAWSTSEPFENEYGYHVGDARDIVSGWIHSTGHNATLLASNTTHGAVSYSHFDTDDKYYWYYNAIEVY